MIKLPKKHLLEAIKKSGIPLLIIAVLLTSFPAYVLGATTNRDGTQSSAYSSGISKSQKSDGSYGSIATETISCSAGKLLANVVASAISTVLGGSLKDKIKDTTKNKALDASEKALTVGIHGDALNSRLDSQTNQQYSANDKLNLQTSASVGQTNPAGIITGVSWDAVAYCIVNSVISYIADSTIRWANGGFNGNPAFIENSGNFFEDLADKEAGTFISELGRLETNGGVNLCSNFKPQIAIGLSKYYSNSSNFRNTSKCSLDKIVKNMETFTNGDFADGGWNGWFSLTQNDQNNRIGATLLAIDELSARISYQNNTAKFELGLNKGFLNYKKCETPGDARSCKTVTPGIVIQEELEKTLSLKKDRLVLAQKFDQVVESIINSLIKKGVSEVLSTSK